jgi:hypothetical protein
MKRLSLDIVIAIACGVSISIISINLAGYMAASTLYPVELFNWAKANSIGKIVFYTYNILNQFVTFGILAAISSYVLSKMLKLSFYKLAWLLFGSQIFVCIAFSWEKFFDSAAQTIQFLQYSSSYFAVIFICTFCPAHLVYKKKNI